MYYIQSLHSHIQANKFFPPRIARQQLLHRGRLLTRLLEDMKQCQYTVIEARAGQGKTTLALQLLEESEIPFLWYQVDREDKDPLFFINALAVALEQKVDRFHSAELDSLFSTGVSVADLPAMVNFLLKALVTPAPVQLTLVFDDLYFLDEAKGTLEVLGHILNTLPPSISCILISRNSLPITSKRLHFANSTLFINNDELSFSLQETEELMAKLLKTHPGQDIVESIHARTDGWAMGIILKSHLIRTRGREHVQETCNELIVYFDEELFLQYDKELQYNLLLLSFLDEIPLELAERITGSTTIAQSLTKLFEKNCFIRNINPQGTLFSFHHFFHSFLQEKAKSLSPKTRETVLQVAGTYFLEKNFLEKAFSFFFAAADYDKMENIVQQYGTEFKKRNRQFLLHETLAAVPTEVMGEYPYLSFYYGQVLVHLDAEAAVDWSMKSRQLFQTKKDKIGELLALSQIIFLYVAHLRNSDKGAQYLDDAGKLFVQCETMLPVTARGLIAGSIAWGFVYLRSDWQQGLFFAEKTEDCAFRSKEIGLQVESKVLQGFVHLFMRDFDKCNAAADWLYERSKKQEISTHHKLMCYYIQLQILHTQNDAIAYRRLKKELIDNVDARVLANSIIQPYLVIYDIDNAIADENFELAARIVADNINSDYFAKPTPLRIELLSLSALIFSYQGQFEEKGRELAEEAMVLVKKGTMPFTRMKTNVLLGAAYGWAGKYTEAISFFDALAQHKEQVPLLVQLWGMMHKACLMQKTGKIPELLDALSFSLTNMELFGYIHIRAFTPSMYKKMLGIAVSNGISKDFVRQLGRSRLQYFCPATGECMPLLCIQTLGDFCLRMDKQEIALSSDFTPGQRQLFGLLLSSPKLRVSQDQAQVTLWPDIPPEKARKRFDTQLSRLRSTLRAKIAPYPIKQYLQLSKGILSLHNCTVDAHEFAALIRAGQHLAASAHWFRASLRFREAMLLWKGEFATDLFNCDQADSYGVALLDRYIDMVLYWASAIMKMGRQEEACDILQEAWVHDRDNEQLVRLLYQLHWQSDQKLRAHQILEQYEKELLQREYSAEEILEVIEDIAHT